MLREHLHLEEEHRVVLAATAQERSVQPLASAAGTLLSESKCLATACHLVT